jgi:hypothetical protein
LLNLHQSYIEGLKITSNLFIFIYKLTCFMLALHSVLGFPRVLGTRIRVRGYGLAAALGLRISKGLGYKGFRVRGFSYFVAVVVVLVVVVGSGGFW